jgi:hypothetical protein
MRALFFIIAMSSFALLSRAQDLPSDTRFVMSHFRADGGGGDERLYISISSDGLNWTALNNGLPVWEPVNWSPVSNVVRDPSIIHANGFYWVAYTSGFIGAQASFGLVKSTDLLHWTFVGDVSTVVPGGADELTWGPFLFQDGDGSVHIFVSINPTGGSHFEVVPGMHSHELHPLNADFTQWSVPVPLTLPNTNTNEFWAWKEGTTYHAIYVDFGQGGAYIHVTATDLLGTWGNAKNLGFNSQEGGFMLRKPEGGYRFYVEPGGNLPSTGYRTCDFDPDFTSHTDLVEVSRTVTMRNGKVAAVGGTSNFAAWQMEKLATVPPANRVPNADPEDDGLANLIECGLDTNPLAPTARKPEAFTRAIGGNTFAGLRFTRLRQCADVTLSVAASGDLNAWGAEPIIESVTLMSDGTEWIHVRDSISVAAGPMRFLRLNATMAAALQPTLGREPPAAKRRSVAGASQTLERRRR